MQHACKTQQYNYNTTHKHLRTRQERLNAFWPFRNAFVPSQTPREAERTIKMLDPSTFDGAGLEMICTYSNLPQLETHLYVRTELLAIYGEAHSRFAPSLETYPKPRINKSIM